MFAAIVTTCECAYWLILGVLGLYGVHRLSLTMAALLAVFPWKGRLSAESFLSRGSPDTPVDQSAQGGSLPIVTVQIPLYNEINVAERVIDAAACLDWPLDRLEIQVLDDSTDDTSGVCAQAVKEWRSRERNIVHIKRTQRIGYKAGALDAGLRISTGGFTLVLDADFVPYPNLLRDTMGAFKDANVGMVQLRWEHLNRDSCKLTEVQALLLDGHFAIEQQVRERRGWFFNFNGTAGIWRNEAIQQAGGWQADTLTEDLDLSYRALLEGWRFRFLLAYSAPAELPANMNAFKSQQFRWAKGSAQVMRKLLPRVLRSSLSLRVKTEAFFHLSQNVPYLLTGILLLLLGPALTMSESSRTPLVASALTFATGGALLAYCLASQKILQRPIRVVPLNTLRLIAVTAGIAFSQSIAVVQGVFHFGLTEFVRTPKQGMSAGKKRWNSARYSGRKSRLPWMELALSGYLAGFLIYAVVEQRYSAVPAFAILSLGAGYVGFLSLRHRG